MAAAKDISVNAAEEAEPDRIFAMNDIKTVLQAFGSCHMFLLYSQPALIRVTLNTAVRSG